jgi:hypothetical protein
MFLGDVVSALGLRERYSGSIKIFARQRALLKKVLAAVVKLLLGVQFLLRCLNVKLRFCVLFR